MKTETEEETMEAHAEEALHCAFRHIQEALDIKTGDFASMWVYEEKWDSIRDWLVSYQKAEVAFEKSSSLEVSK